MNHNQADSLIAAANAASIEHKHRMAAERLMLGPRPTMGANLEQALTLTEMEMLVDLLDPLHDYETRVSEENLPHTHRLHEMLLFAIRRRKFSEGTAAIEGRDVL